MRCLYYLLAPSIRIRELEYKTPIESERWRALALFQPESWKLDLICRYLSKPIILMLIGMGEALAIIRLIPAPLPKIQFRHLCARWGWRARGNNAINSAGAESAQLQRPARSVFFAHQNQRCIDWTILCMRNNLACQWVGNNSNQCRILYWRTPVKSCI